MAACAGEMPQHRPAVANADTAAPAFSDAQPAALDAAPSPDGGPARDDGSRLSPPPAGDPCSAARVDGNHCAAALDPALGHGELYVCVGGKTWSVRACPTGCQVMPPGVEDACVGAPGDPCSTAQYGDGGYCAASLDPAAEDPRLYTCHGERTAGVVFCSAGCHVMPPGLDDACAAPGGAAMIGRAQAWVDVDMPYCGGVNRGPDAICDGTCQRSGAADRAEWNVYRSDCSGFISYVWQLPPVDGGRRTWELAPFDTSVSEEVDAAALQPGDALNATIADLQSQHVMLFAGWIDSALHLARIIDEANCHDDIVDAQRTLTLLGGSRVLVSGRAHEFAAIRRR